MTILGKLLIFFNLLAAGAFAYFTLENWKVRKDLTKHAIVREIQLNGLPVEPGTPPADLDSDSVAFNIAINKVPYDSIPKSTIKAALPNGDETLGASGGDPVANQQDEVKRVLAKVFSNIPALNVDPKNRFLWLRAYTLSLAKTGAERDGLNAVFDMLDPNKAYAARRDLPLAARTESQTAALRALVDISDLGDPAITETIRATRIASAREAVKRFVLGEVQYGAGSPDQQSPEYRKLTNALLTAMQDRAGEAEKKAVEEATTVKESGFAHIAAVAVEPLADKPSIDRAAVALTAYAQLKAITPTEKLALTAIDDLIRPPLQGFNLDATVDAAGTNLLTAKFEEAMLPAATKATATASPAGEKARKIAHLLYHIDGWRYADPTATAARKAWHERVATVIGLPEYIRAAEAEATEYAEAAQRLTAVITEEQSAFEAEHQAHLQRILFLYSRWLILDQQLKAQQVTTAENERLMNERKTERDNLVVELADSKEKAKVALAGLTKTQKDQFVIIKQLRDAQEALLVLEKQLRELEFKVQRDDLTQK